MGDLNVWGAPTGVGGGGWGSSWCRAGPRHHGVPTFLGSSSGCAAGSSYKTHAAIPKTPTPSPPSPAARDRGHPARLPPPPSPLLPHSGDPTCSGSARRRRDNAQAQGVRLPRGCEMLRLRPAFLFTNTHPWNRSSSVIVPYGGSAAKLAGVCPPGPRNPQGGMLFLVSSQALCAFSRRNSKANH